LVAGGQWFRVDGNIQQLDSQHRHVPPGAKLDQRPGYGSPECGYIKTSCRMPDADF